MTVFAVDPMCLGAFAEELVKRVGAVDDVRVVEFDALADGKPQRDATIVVAGASLWNPARKNAFSARLLELGYESVLNLPSAIYDRCAFHQSISLAGESARGQWRLTEAPIPPPFPVQLSFDIPIQTQSSHLLADTLDLNEALMQLTFGGIEPDRVWMTGAEPDGVAERYSALVAPGAWLCWTSGETGRAIDVTGSLPPSVYGAIQAWTREAGLDVARVDVGVVDGQPKLWRVDDRPMSFTVPESHLTDAFSSWIRAISGQRQLSTHP